MPRPSEAGSVTDALKAAKGPTTIARLVYSSGVSARVVRKHLRDLVESGHVHKTVAPPDGKGRPPSLYTYVGAKRSRAKRTMTMEEVGQALSPAPVAKEEFPDA